MVQLNAVNSEGSTPLHTACSVDSWQTVQILLENGAGNLESGRKEEGEREECEAIRYLYCYRFEC